jgi:hypothetical protein
MASFLSNVEHLRRNVHASNKIVIQALPNERRADGCPIG